jgi:glycosyltransferase involved in cell wall biosynthesis
MAKADESPSRSKDPEVTVVIPTHDRPALLPRAIKSVLLQTFVQVEVLIVDDAST